MEEKTQPKSNFVRLHTHSHYSMLDGMGKVPDLVNRAKELGMNSLALTDHGVMHGAIEFYEECEKAEIKPIIGCEVYVAPRTLHDKVPRVDAHPYHLILLAKDETGYRNLIELTTIAHLEGYYYKPRVDKKLLRKHSAGLIATSACMQGEVPRKIIEDFDKAKEAVEEYIDIFGKENFYLEVQKHPHVENQDKANKLIFKLAGKLDLKVIATNDIHYVNADDREAQDALICLQTTRLMDETDRMSMRDDDYSMLSEEDILAAFPDHPEVAQVTQEIAQKCNIRLELGGILMPEFPIPDGETIDDHFLAKTYRGLNKKYGSGSVDTEKLGNDIEASDLKITGEIWERFQYEYGVITAMKYQGYFLIVADFINWAKDQGISVGPGRGSGAGSIIAYTLNITELDP